MIIADERTDFPCRVMMAHYFHHLARVNKQFFTLIAIVYARYTNDYWDDYWLYGKDDNRKLLPSLLQVVYVFLNWVCIRYQYRLPFNLFLHSIVMVIEPINLLYSFVRPGKKQQMNLLRTRSKLIIIWSWVDPLLLTYVGIYYVKNRC